MSKIFKSPLFWVNVVILGTFLLAYIRTNLEPDGGVQSTYYLGLIMAFPMILVLIIVDCIYLLAGHSSSQAASQKKNSPMSLAKLAVLTFILGGSAILLTAIAWVFIQFQNG